jgi:glycosyltransferase involved in cell wall biosynthesis
MKIVFLSQHMKFSGGRRLHFDYAKYLMSAGHDVSVLVIKDIGELKGYLPVITVPAFDSRHIPECDLIIATTPKDVKVALESGTGKVVHFCQGYDNIDMEKRINENIIPPRYQGSGLLHRIILFRKKIQWRKTLREWEGIYRLPTYLISISSHLQDELEKRYGRPAPLCRNGIDLKIFYPEKDRTCRNFSESSPMRIINIGPYDVTYKGIQTTLEAVKKAKEAGMNIDFMRIAPIASSAETALNPIYPIKIGVPQDEFCSTIRSCDVYISNSTDREGFGLPAMEAMASGLVPILSDINCYRSFSGSSDHCIFVPEGDSGATFKAIERLYRMNPSEFQSMREKSIAVSNDFSFDRACARFEELLKSFLAPSYKNFIGTQ